MNDSKEQQNGCYKQQIIVLGAKGSLFEMLSMVSVVFFTVGK
ncbi:MAG: hypothetical protein V9G16_10260 [Nitrosomonas sp.]